MSENASSDLPIEEKSVKCHMEKLLNENAPRGWETWNGTKKEAAEKMAERYLGKNWLHDLWCAWHAKNWKSLPESLPDHLQQYSLLSDENTPGCC